MFRFVFGVLLVSVVAVFAQVETYTHLLDQSTVEYQFWTTPPSERVFKDDAVPTATASEIRVYAAKNEFEPFQVIVRPALSGTVTFQIDEFGSDITTECYQVKTVPITQTSDNLGRLGDYPDPLWPIEDGDNIDVVANENTSFWITLHVPASASAGDHLAQVTIGGISIPVRLHVFDFSIPDQLHVKSQMNFSHNAVLNAYSVSGTGDDYWMYVDMMKQFFIDHRLTPKAPLWSGGLTTNGAAPYIDYDCNGTFTDNDGIWGFEDPADKYLDGNGFNDGTGFPGFMVATFQNNDASQDQRPSSFCGLNRSSDDWYLNDDPTTAYNQKWFQYIGAMESYLQSLGYLDKAYYYFANEPQDQADYDAVAWYSEQLKTAAPNLDLMVSEEPKPEIYDQPGAKIDIWLPVLNQYDPDVSHDRAVNHGEETWIYFLHGTRPPYFNPITLDHPGIESKLTGWFLWKYRVRGIAYYSMNTWSQNPWTDPLNSGHNGDLFMLYPPSEDNQPIAYGSNNHRMVPSIRFELMRDSFEDYEYLYVLNGSQQPQVGVATAADDQADKMISGLTSYTRDGEFHYNLRRVIGEKNGGEIASIPDLQPPSGHPRAQGDPGDYYINFQDPNGNPTDDPLQVNGHDYMKIGWNTYDEALGYGWYGDMAHVMYQYLSSGPNELQKSILYDDWGRQKTFEFDLPSGDYDVTVSVGWQGRSYSHNYIEIEGVVFVDDEAADPYLVRTVPVTVDDNKLTMNMGIFDRYTMLNYMDIEAVKPSVQATVDLFLQGFYAGSGLMTTDLNSGGHLPTDSPFAQDPRSVDTIPAGVSDWVLVELRNEPFGSPVVQKSQFLKNDGTVVDLDGSTSTLVLTDVEPGNYYLAVHSRNHLTALSAAPVPLSESAVTAYDFTTGPEMFYGSSGVMVDGSETAAAAGDIDGDGHITSSDFVEFYNHSLTITPGYHAGDLDGDGLVDATDYGLWVGNAESGR
jgi:hypothetical protein